MSTRIYHTLISHSRLLKTPISLINVEILYIPFIIRVKDFWSTNSVFTQYYQR